ncbi:MAG: beta-ketoacyl-ACP synthase II [Anaerolineales bacterium]|nr:beta-ketoacyl-ACP synthase II [Anaerolineales bacterium]
MTNPRPRVVITGMGAITPLGLTVPELWQGLLEGRSGISRISQFDAGFLPCQIAGEVKGFDPGRYINIKEARRMARCSQFVLSTAQEALRAAGLEGGFPDPERVGVLLGTAVGGWDRMAEGLKVMWNQGYLKVNPFIPPSSIPNMPGHHLSQKYQALGPLNTVPTACAAGTQAIGEAAELVRRGAADIVLTGGVEALVVDFMIASFCVMRALPVNFNDFPERASRPFTRDREGFVFSEGCAILVVESLESARERGAPIVAEILGQSSSSDAFHIAAPDPTSKGAVRAIRWALADAGITPEQVDYINAHGTSTPANDLMETNAIKQVFGERAKRIPVSSTKSMIGHPLGAAGAIEAVACALTLRDGMIHPTINYDNPDPECDLDYVPNVKRPADVRIALSNSFGLGGQNACLVLRRWEEE